MAEVTNSSSQVELRPQSRGEGQATRLYPLRPRGEGTADVENLYSYFLTLSGEHSLPPRRVLAELSGTATWHELGHSQGRHWDNRHGADLIGVGGVADRWAKLLAVATGVETLALSTFAGLSHFVCGIGLIFPRQRVCLGCLADDANAGLMPYERLWWRVASVTCCSQHKSRLVEPTCSARPDHSSTHYVPKRAGVCPDCGSVGFKCHQVQLADDPPTEREIWTANQVRKLIAALPELAKANHLQMKDAIAHYCNVGGGKASLARRANMAKSQMSYWLRKPRARTSLAQLLDIALVEQFDLTDLLLGKLSKEAVSGDRDPCRKKRRSRRVDHEELSRRLKVALVQGKKVSEVAEEFGVDISTVAKHEDPYLALREQTQDKMDAAETLRRNKAIEEAETVIELLVNDGITPSLRAASELTGDAWYPSQLRAMSLTMLRLKLGDRRVSVPPRMAATGYEFRKSLDASSIRLRQRLGFTTSQSAP